MKPYYSDEWVKHYCSDALTVLRGLEDDTIDLLCTDPPYGISFMGKSWDKALPNINIWKECLRVLKPGAFAFVMSIPRSDCLSRMIISLEDAGFRVDFTPIYWTYASGFPKAQNIGKAVDKRGGKYLGWFIDYILEVAKDKGISRRELTMLFPSRNNKPTGWLWNKQFTQAITLEQYGKIKEFLNLPFESIKEAEREVIGKGESGKTAIWQENGGMGDFDITTPATSQAKALDGSYGGFQPKPAVEVIIVAMKPLSEKTFVDQALKNGKGITWLDDCRVPYESEGDKESARFGTQMDIRGGNLKTPIGIKAKNVLSSQSGRFPANLIVSDDVLNDGTNYKKGGSIRSAGMRHNQVYGEDKRPRGDWNSYNDSGSFSRYFDLDAWAKTLPFLIVPKASKSEKNKGLDSVKIGGSAGEITVRGNTNPVCLKCGGSQIDRGKGICQCGEPEYLAVNKTTQNFHPTVKPLKLMSYLITLGSRSGDTVLDPFMGSGTTAVAAKTLNRKCIGIEIEERYAEIAAKRCAQAVMELMI